MPGRLGAPGRATGGDHHDDDPADDHQHNASADYQHYESSDHEHNASADEHNASADYEHYESSDYVVLDASSGLFNDYASRCQHYDNDGATHWHHADDGATLRTPPPLTDPPDGVEVMPPLEAVVVDPVNKVVDLGPLAVPQRTDLEAALDPPPPLAGTGLNETGMVLAALGLILAGSLLVVGSHRLQKKSPGT
jgi:hypothetical protein